MKRRASRAWRLVAAALSAATVVVGGCGAKRVAQDPSPQLRARTFDCYWNALNDDFPYFEHVGVDWPAMRERYRTRAIEAPDTYSYYGVMSEMFAELKDPHLNLQTMRAPIIAGSKEFGSIAPATVEIGKRTYIWSWSDTGGCFGQDMEAYPELVARRGLRWSWFQTATDLAFYEPVATPDSLETRDEFGDVRIEPMPRQFSPSRGYVQAVIVPQREFRRNFMAGTPLEVSQTGIWSSKVLVDDMRHYEDPIRQSPFRALSQNGARPPGRGGASPRPWWIESRRFQSVGYLRLSSFRSTQQVNGHQPRFGPVFRSEMPKLLDAPSLIIDLRYNGGGNRIPVQDALAWFSEKPIAFGLSPWTHLGQVIRGPVIFAVKPNRHRFQGRVVILVNRFSASAAEVFATFMREHNGAIIVGETTLGAEAGVEVVPGPDGSLLSYGSIPFIYPGSSSFQTTGLVPDVQVPLTIERVREIGYSAAVHENEIEQVRAACRLLGVEADEVLSVQR